MIHSGHFCRVLLFFILMGPLVVAAQEQASPVVSGSKADMDMRARLDARLAELKQDEAAYQKAMEDGRSRTTLCKTCHGEDGKSVKEEVPNLAGQNAVYMVDQFMRFRDGRRDHFLMSSLAKSFSEDDVLQLSLFYSSLPDVTFGGGREELVADGQKLYSERCSSCHGKDGRSETGYARLAGQRPDYVVKMLKEFKERSGSRTNAWMSEVALKLNHQQMEALAAYLASL